MVKEEKDARERILKATTDLLNERRDPERINVREIAEKAAVSLGSINYHFQSKDNLVFEAVSQMVNLAAVQYTDTSIENEAAPMDRLRHLVTETSRVLFHFPQLGRVMIEHDLMQGEMGTPLLVVPLLREILGDGYEEIELRLLAMAFITTLQIAFLRPDIFRLYSGFDLQDEAGLNKAVDMLITLLIERNFP